MVKVYSFDISVISMRGKEIREYTGVTKDSVWEEVLRVQKSLVEMNYIIEGVYNIQESELSGSKEEMLELYHSNSYYINGCIRVGLYQRDGKYYVAYSGIDKPDIIYDIEEDKYIELERGELLYKWLQGEGLVYGGASRGDA